MLKFTRHIFMVTLIALVVQRSQGISPTSWLITAGVIGVVIGGPSPVGRRLLVTARNITYVSVVNTDVWLGLHVATALFIC